MERDNKGRFIKVEWIKKNCKFCNKEFYIIPSRNSEAKFCSSNCSIKWHRGLNHPNYHKPMKKEQIIKIREARLKQPDPRLGKHHTKETIEHMRLIKLGIRHTPKQIEKLKENARNNPNYGMKGKKHSKEARIKMKHKRNLRIIPMKDTSIELKIQNFLRLLHIEFIAHYYIKEISHAYQCDIIIPSKKLIIEADGCYWHGCPVCNKNINEWQEKQIEEDKIRTKELEAKGYRVIRLKEHDIKIMNIINFRRVIQ